MSNEYPLYPRLTEEGEKEAQRIMDSFKPRIKSLVDELMGDLYCEVAHHIESDAWTNYKNDMLDGFKGYKENCDKHPRDFKELRQAIYSNNKEEIIRDLNKDLVNENKGLQEHIDLLQKQMHDRY